MRARICLQTSRRVRRGLRATWFARFVLLVRFTGTFVFVTLFVASFHYPNRLITHVGQYFTTFINIIIMSRVVVKNLPSSGISETDLRKHFEDIDNITDIKLKYNDFGVFRRFAFVGFKTAQGAEKAIEKLNSTFIKNSKLTIEPCKAIKEVKAEKVVASKRHKQQQSDNSLSDIIENNDDRENCTNNKKSKKSKKKAPDAFEEVKDDAEFKEFLDLQRNIGENSKIKRIWSDDTKMEANVAIAEPIKSCSNSEPTNDDDDQLKGKKRHKRSRGKKTKPIKTKPKELFVHTVKMGGLPEKVRRKDVKDFFKPLEVLSVRLNKRDDVCYVSFKDESDLRFAMRKNLQFWGTSRIKLWRHDVKKSRIFKETIREKIKQKEETIKKQEKSLVDSEPLEESGRLFVRNLNYTCTQEDLEQVFSKYGELTEIHFPIDKKTSLPKGYAYVEFMFPQNAAQAYDELNGTIFQGRNFHLIPSRPKPDQYRWEQRVDGRSGKSSFDLQSSFKREKFSNQKESAGKGCNWNILFLGQNALADVVCDRKGIDKSKLLTEQASKEPIAVRMALGDATVVEEMRKFLISNGIELDSFDNAQAARSRTVILVKNLPSQADKSELVKLFETHGKVARIIMPPNGLSALVEMEEPVEAKLAFNKLAYRKYMDSILYLEWAPINVFGEKSLEEQDESEMKQLASLQTGSKILVKNVPFEATVGELRKVFGAYGELNFVRLPKKIDGQHRGFGFVDYVSKEEAMRAYRALCHSTHLYGRKLVLEWAAGDEGVRAGAGAGAGAAAAAKTKKETNK